MQLDVHGVKAQLFPAKKIQDRRLAGVATLCNMVQLGKSEPTLVVVATERAAQVATDALTDHFLSEQTGYGFVRRDVDSVVEDRFRAVVDRKSSPLTGEDPSIQGKNGKGRVKLRAKVPHILQPHTYGRPGQSLVSPLPAHFCSTVDQTKLFFKQILYFSMRL